MASSAASPAPAHMHSLSYKKRASPAARRRAPRARAAPPAIVRVGTSSEHREQGVYRRAAASSYTEEREARRRLGAGAGALTHPEADSTAWIDLTPRRVGWGVS